jgi:pimeloyl-ACP methyl ester carboxylesterase
MNSCVYKRAILGLLLLLQGCTFSIGSRPFVADPEARWLPLTEAGFIEHSPQHLPLRSWVRLYPSAHTTAPVFVVIEADGAPWRASGYLPPANPTPSRAVGAEVAITLARAFSASVVYLGRHCQFVTLQHAGFAQRCVSARLWTGARFAPEVVADLRAWIHEISTVFPVLQSGPWVLTGFSGGGTMAALLAPRLPNVVCLVTFASPLDLARWAQVVQRSPLDESLDPADDLLALAALPRFGFWFGEKDSVVPITSLGRISDALAPRARSQHLVPGLGHSPVDPWIKAAAQRIEATCLDGLQSARRRP